MHFAATDPRIKFGEEMSIGKTPNYAKFCSDQTRSVLGICGRKFVSQLPKNGPNSPKSLKTCYTLKHVPHHAKFHRNRWNHLGEKCCKIFFTPFNILAPQGDPLVTGLSVGYINYPPPLATYKISSRFDDFCPRYLLPNFVDFVAGVNHKNIP